MKLFIEGYQYSNEESTILLKKILNFEQGGSFSTDMVGYYYSNDVNDTVFFLPKVVLDKDDMLFGKYNPEDIIDLQDALDKKKITEDEYRFIYGLSVWIYRAINVFRNTADDEHRKILLYRDIPTDSLSGNNVYNTFLDILISLQRFNDENQNFFTFILKNIHSGYNKINWTKTISHGQAILQDDTPIYLNVVNRKKQVNLEEELFIIFFSILKHMQTKYGFPVKINYNFPLITDDAFDNYLDGYGEIRLIQIRHKYFSDKQVKMWQLCYDFFCQQSQIQNNSHYSDHLLAKDFNIVFEAMIDHLLSEKDKRIEQMNLKDQTDGKRVDHIYAWDGLMHNDNEIFYIGDSKYYKLSNTPGSYSIYKQYTYARNVIQANLDLFNQKDEKGRKTKKPGDDYLIYRDEDTEGYNITPNFFIRAHVPNDLDDYDSDDLEAQNGMEKKVHFENRLFDRDTLLLQHYNINFLYVLSVYGSEDVLAQETFRQKARTLFRERIIEGIKDEYNFFSLQLKPTVRDDYDGDEEDTETVRDKMNRIVEKKYFHKLLGKAFRPYKEQEFLYLSLESKKEYFDDNIKLLSELSTDFNIRHYALGTNPTDSINKFAELTFTVVAGVGANAGQKSKVYKFIDMADEIFLVGGWRKDKNQKEWIVQNMLYNVRASVNRHGYVDGIIDSDIPSARYLILYEIGDNDKRNYDIYEIGGFKKHSESWMRDKGYPTPDGDYIVYNLNKLEHFENVNVNAMLLLCNYQEIAKMKSHDEPITQKNIQGAPGYLSGSNIDEIALSSHKKTSKALVVVNIGDKDLDKITTGLSVATFVADKTPNVIKSFSEASYVVYSNKQKHKVFQIIGDAFISVDSQPGFMERRYAEPIKDVYTTLSERNKVKPDFYLNLMLSKPTGELSTLDQGKINKAIPQGLTSYDMRLVDIESIIKS